MLRKTLIASLIAAMLATGCGESEKPKPAQQTESEKKVGQNSAAAQALENEKKIQEAKAQPDKSVPLANYTALDYGDKDLGWLTFIAVAQSGTATSDEELLNLFSARYYNEKDAFKKRELAPLELPGIKSLLEKYKAQKYYSVSFHVPGNDGDPLHWAIFMDGPYSFDTKSFNITGSNCLSQSVTNRQGVNIQFKKQTESLCSVKIEDMALAKTIEEHRAKSKADLSGTIYFFVQEVDGNQVKAIVTGVHYDIYDRPYYEKGRKLLTSFDA